MLIPNRSIVAVAKNSSWNLAAFATTIGVNLIMLPYVVRLLGIRQFGVCGLLISFCAPFTVIAATLSQTTCQSVARYRARGDWAAVRQVCATANALAITCLSAGALLLLCILLIASRRLLNTDGSSSAPALLVTALLLCGWIAQQTSQLIQGIHVACMAYRRIATISATCALLGLGVTFTLVTLMPSVLGYIAALAAVQLVTLLAWLWSAYASFRWCLVAPNTVAEVRKSMLAFSGWLSFSQLVTAFSAQSDRYALGVWSRTVAVGYYNIAMRILEAASSVMLRAGDSLFPHFSAKITDDVNSDAHFFVNACWLMNLVAAAVIAPIFPLAPYLIRDWVDAGAAVNATGVLRTLIVAGILANASYVFKQYLLGAAMTRRLALLGVVTGVVAALTALLLVPKFGLRAAGISAVTSMSIQLVIVIYLIREHFGSAITAGRLFNSTLIPVGTAFGMALLLAHYGTFSVVGWPRLIALYLIEGLAIICGIFLLNSLTRDGRALLANLLRLMD